MADESYLKSLVVLALKREGYAIKSDQVNIGTWGSDHYRREVIIPHTVNSHGRSEMALAPHEMCAWADLPSGVRRIWRGSRVEIENQLRKAMEGR